MIAANTRLKAAQQLGMTEVPVRWFDGTDVDAWRAIWPTKGATSTRSETMPRLARLLEHLKKGDALDGVGSSEGDIDAIVAEAAQTNAEGRETAISGLQKLARVGRMLADAAAR